MGNAALTTKIPVKDREGRIIDEKEVATYAGLLAKAHEEGLSAITTRLVQVPHGDNGDTAIVEATVTTGKGTYSGIGDANPGNVNRRVAAHVIRMAETRAKARALRDAVNIGVVSLEELGGDEAEVAPSRPVAAPPRPAPARPPLREVPRHAHDDHRRPSSPSDHRHIPAGERPAPQRGAAPAPRRESAPANAGPQGMTENQRRWLYRYLAERGFEGESATDALCKAAGVDNVGDITKSVASGLIDAWKQDAEGGGHAA